MEKVQILGIPFDNVTNEEMVEMLSKRIENQQRCFTVTANPEIVMFAQNDPLFMKSLHKADFIVPDGIGVIIGSKLLNHPLKERVAGFDLMMSLLEEAHLKGYRVYFLGAEDSIVKKAVKNCMDKYPNLNIVGFHHGYFDLEDEEIVRNIQKTKPDFIFVALGFPRQEYWISKHISTFEKGVFMGVGGSFDVLAGKVKRAPIIWQKLYIEWLYRLLQQPSRWRRMLVLPKFLVRVIKLKLNPNKK